MNHDEEHLVGAAAGGWMLQVEQVVDPQVGAVIRRAHRFAATLRRRSCGRDSGPSATMAGMRLPVMPPVAPMLAKSFEQIPHGAMSFEPKWDGFRPIVFRDSAEVEIGSRNEKPMTRYFPELVDAMRASLPERCVLDGEIIVVGSSGDRLDFELLPHGDPDYPRRPFAERRAALVDALSSATPPIHVTAATTDRALAEQWF